MVGTRAEALARETNLLLPSHPVPDHRDRPAQRATGRNLCAGSVERSICSPTIPLPCCGLRAERRYAPGWPELVHIVAADTQVVVVAGADHPPLTAQTLEPTDQPLVILDATLPGGGVLPEHMSSRRAEPAAIVGSTTGVRRCGAGTRNNLTAPPRRFVPSSRCCSPMSAPRLPKSHWRRVAGMSGQHDRRSGLMAGGSGQDRVGFRFMPVTAAIGAQLRAAGVVQGLRIGLSLVLEPKTANLARVLATAGADVSVVCDAASTRDDVAAALSHEGITVFAVATLIPTPTTPWRSPSSTAATTSSSTTGPICSNWRTPNVATSSMTSWLPPRRRRAGCGRYVRWKNLGHCAFR